MRFHNENPAGECHDQQTDRQLQDENLSRQIRVANVRGICFLDACKCMWNDIDIVYIQYMLIYMMPYWAHQLTVVGLIVHDYHATVPQAIPGWRVSSRDLHTLHILRHRCAHVDSLWNTH